MSRALWGIVAVWIGTVLALMAMPADPVPAGALVQSGLWQAAGLLVLPCWQLFTDWRGVLRAEYLLTAGLIIWLLLDVIQGSYPLTGLDPSDIENIFLAIAAMASAVWLGTIARPWSLPTSVVRAATFPFSPQRAYVFILVLFGLGIFYFWSSSGFNPVVMFEALGRNRWAAPWARGRLGGWDSFVEHMRYFGYVVPALTVVYAHYAGWLRGKTIFAIILSIIIIAFASQGGGRRITGVMLGAALICWILLQPRLRPRVVIGSVLAVILFGIGLQLMIENRSHGFQQMESLQVQSDKLHIDDNFYRLGQITTIFPDEHPYVYTEQVTFALIRPIPRALWSGKPEHPGYDFSSMVTDQQVSLTTSVIGEFFASWGWLGILLGGYVYGRLGSMWNRLLEARIPYAVLLYGMGALALFAGLRSMLDLVLMSYLVLAWLGVTYLLESRPQWKGLPGRRSVPPRKKPYR